MPTKLSRFCEGIMEAAWLAAILLVPVFFNVYSSRIFEPDKIALLRSLAWVTLAAWLVKLVDAGLPAVPDLSPGESRWKALWRTPLVAPVAALAGVYLLSTLFSINPLVSLLGSYQRLQGTYTTFSYLVLFAAVAATARRKEQIERILTAAILASFPVGLYGILQRLRLDPIPWGGNVTERIAANMGNSIFVAAYLILVFPPTALRVLDAARGMLRDEHRLGSNFSRAFGYLVIAIVQALALYFSGSRGPWLGWGASLFFMGVILALIWRKRRLLLGVLGAAAALAIFLAALNIPGGPLEGLRARPELGRLGQLLDAGSRTGRVRTLIWQGAAELVAPHEPLEYPGGRRDPFNVLRPLIGYGPESMYVAYNRFYQPGLTQVEKRNASPDRSHNETWDALVITGALGLATYLALFGSVIYYGLKWLGFVPGRKERNLFLGLYVGVGALAAAGFVAWRGPAYLGVSLPAGMMLGVALYLAAAALTGRYRVPETPAERQRALLLLGLLAAVVAHFVEINFGIAIAATRLYFWVYSACLLCVGALIPAEAWVEADAPLPAEAQPAAARKKRRQPKAPAATPGDPWPAWQREAGVGSLMAALLLVTLGWDFISAAQGGRSVLAVLAASLGGRAIAAQGASYGVLVMAALTWLIGSLLAAAESGAQHEDKDLVRKFLAVAGVSLLFGAVYWILQAAWLAALARSTLTSLESVLRQVGSLQNLLLLYASAVLALLLGWAVFLSAPAQSGEPAGRLGLYAAPVAALAALALAFFTNLRGVQADIAYKLAEPFTRQGSWPVAIAIYQDASVLAPREDYYDLFLGRAYLEQARQAGDTAEREALLAQAEGSLKKAQALSPLNPDHTANLARLYSLWATYSDDAALRRQRAETSSRYFEQAIQLSPRNSRLYDEWSLLYLNVLQQPEEAGRLLRQSQALDPTYDWTYALLGDFSVRRVETLSDTAQKQEGLYQAAEYYRQALELAPESDARSRYGYALSLAGVYAQLNQVDGAILAYQQALALSAGGADNWRIEETIARLYAEQGDLNSARLHARAALDAAPADQRERLQLLVEQMGG